MTTELITFDDGKVALIKRTVAKDATNDELELFLHQCRRTGLDPLARQIYFQKYQTKNGPQIAIITGIDGYRLIADRTGCYAGNDDAVYEGKGEGVAFNRPYFFPHKATVTVWKLVGNQRVPFAASAYWSEYYPGDDGRGSMWRKMPHVMLAKVAEALALRKAFPADLSGMYTREEMDQADWTDAPPVAQLPTRQVDTTTGEITEGAIVEFDELTPAAPANGKQDSRGDAAPAAQAERATRRPTRDGEAPDWEAKALGAKNLSAFVAAAAMLFPEYGKAGDVKAAMESWPDFEYDAEHNAEYLDALRERKETA